MKAYKAPPKPFLKSLSENLFLQLILVFVIGFGTVFYLRKNSKEKLQARAQYLRGAPVQLESDDRHQFSSAQNTEASNVGEFETREKPTAATATSQDTASKGPEVKIFFLQMSTATLAQWIESEVLTRVETSDGVMMGYLQDFSQIIAQGRGAVRVLKTDSFPLVTEQIFASKMELPRRDDNNNRQIAQTSQQAPAPLTAYATLDSITDETVSGQLEISVDPQNSFPVQFDMSSSSALLMTGFSKLRTPEKSPETELVVVISLKK